MADIAAVHIRDARSPDDLEAARQLFAAYADSLGIDLSFQDFSEELKTLPGKYASPSGEILLACNHSDMAVGCVAMRPLSSEICEMKRLYILPAGRGLGIGTLLVNRILEVASNLGYNEIKLDTLPTMSRAIAVYTKVGFTPIEPYYENPIVEAIFFARRLGHQVPEGCDLSPRLLGNHLQG